TSLRCRSIEYRIVSCHRASRDGWSGLDGARATEPRGIGRTGIERSALERDGAIDRERHAADLGSHTDRVITDDAIHLRERERLVEVAGAHDRDRLRHRER